jgi:hypothetical protein
MLEWLLFKTQNINVDEAIRKRESFHTVGRDAKIKLAIMENSMEVTEKT